MRVAAGQQILMVSWQGKVVLVSGGSAGLGFYIARAFGRRGATVVIAARGQEALDRACAQLTGEGIRAAAMTADVTRQEQVDSLVGQAIARWGRIDAVVNSAGRSARGRAIDTTVEQFQELWELNFLGVVRLSRAAMPHLLASRGHLVNIGSLAGKSAARWLGAYPATKFAVTAYSQQLRLEMEPQGLHVLLVAPGPIASASRRDHRESELRGLPPGALRPGGGVKVRAIDPDRLAERIVRACERRQPELVVPSKARLLFSLSALWPRLGDRLVRLMTS
jgi:NAD(P)-dependent dehydrogenase (short-subunit alcohol dehydrogenase family)